MAGPNVSGSPRDWNVYHYITDNPQAPVSLDPGGSAPVGPPPAVGTPGTPGTLTFDSAGKLIGNGQVPLAPYVTGTSASDITINMNYLKSTQLSAAFSVDALRQDGLPAGQLTGVNVDSSGVIFARFSNGAATPLGKVALTRFPNPQGLSKLGDTNWAQSANSGEPIPGEAGNGNFGVIQAGALEQSNVDLSAQLVNLIVAQQSYQANSQTISTENTIISTILNIR